MKLVYYPDHDKRYGHIPKRLRPLYPDEIRLASITIKRTKLFKDVTTADVRKYGVHPCLIAKDVPYTDGLHDG